MKPGIPGLEHLGCGGIHRCLYLYTPSIQARTEAERMGDWALESLAGKLLPLFPKQGTDNRVNNKEGMEPA